MLVAGHSPYKTIPEVQYCTVPYFLGTILNFLEPIQYCNSFFTEPFPSAEKGTHPNRTQNVKNEQLLPFELI